MRDFIKKNIVEIVIVASIALVVALFAVSKASADDTTVAPNCKTVEQWHEEDADFVKRSNYPADSLKVYDKTDDPELVKLLVQAAKDNVPAVIGYPIDTAVFVELAYLDTESSQQYKARFYDAKGCFITAVGGSGIAAIVAKGLFDEVFTEYRKTHKAI